MTSDKIDKIIVESYIKTYISLKTKGRSTDKIADRLILLFKRIQKEKP